MSLDFFWIEVINMPLVEISVKKGAFTAEELEQFAKDVMDQILKTYKELKGKEPAQRAR